MTNEKSKATNKVTLGLPREGGGGGNFLQEDNGNVPLDGVA